MDARLLTSSIRSRRYLRNARWTTTRCAAAAARGHARHDPSRRQPVRACAQGDKLGATMAREKAEPAPTCRPLPAGSCTPPAPPRCRARLHQPRSLLRALPRAPALAYLNCPHGVTRKILKAVSRVPTDRGDEVGTRRSGMSDDEDGASYGARVCLQSALDCPRRVLPANARERAPKFMRDELAVRGGGGGGESDLQLPKATVFRCARACTPSVCMCTGVCARMRRCSSPVVRSISPCRSGLPRIRSCARAADTYGPPRIHIRVFMSAHQHHQGSTAGRPEMLQRDGQSDYGMLYGISAHGV